MNAFEEIVAGLLHQGGYWTIVGYKVNLSKEKKEQLGKPTMPRPEIDVLAYHVGQNRLLWVECKSYLDSTGVTFKSFDPNKDPSVGRFKVFTWDDYRLIVTDELVKQVVADGMTADNPEVQYCLVAGKVASETDRECIRLYFNELGWLFYDDKWLKEKLQKASTGSYEDDIAVIVAKLFCR